MHWIWYEAGLGLSWLACTCGNSFIKQKRYSFATIITLKVHSNLYWTVAVDTKEIWQNKRSAVLFKIVGSELSVPVHNDSLIIVTGN